MTDASAKELTIKIFVVIWEEITGLDADEITKRTVAEESESSPEFQKIQNLIKNHKQA